MSYLQRIFRSNLPMNRWISSIENNNLLINQLQQQQQLNRFKLLSTTTTTTNNQNIKYDNETLNRMIQQNKVVIFMKGIPEQPRCGFSNAVVQVLRMHGVEFQSYNVLESDELRQAIKNFTSWPTIPQIFLNGEFIGGCDILLEKHQNGELIDDLAKIGIKSKINDNDNDDNSSNKGQEKSK